MKVSPNTFVAVLDAALVAISEMRSKKSSAGISSENFVSLIFSTNEIRIEYVSHTLCFTTSVPSSDISASATARSSRAVVHLKDLVNLLRCCCDNSSEELEIEELDEVIFLKSGTNFEAEISTVNESIFLPSTQSTSSSTPSSHVARFIADSDLLFSSFHQFLVTPVPNKIVVSILCSGNIEIYNTEEDRAEFPLSTYVEIARQFLSDFVCITPIAFALLGSCLPPLCSFLSSGGKCEVSLSCDSWLVFRRKLISNTDGEIRVYVSSLDVVGGG